MALVHGLDWNRDGVTGLTRIDWRSLLVIDPLTALLLYAIPRARLILCVAVIVTDSAHNSWFTLHHPVCMNLYLSQIGFLLFVAFSVRTAWREAASRRVGLGVIN